MLKIITGIRTASSYEVLTGAGWRSSEPTVKPTESHTTHRDTAQLEPGVQAQVLPYILGFLTITKDSVLA